MNRLEDKLKDLKDNNKKALITFVTAGDPDINTTKELVKEMEKRGADIIELGIPFSDPIAEGPVIQAANVRALSGGVCISSIMQAVGEMRGEVVCVPLLFLLYYNCIFKYGIDEFFRKCKDVGIDGVIIPDLPFEESIEIKDAAQKYDIIHISLISPTSKDRMKKITENARGFLYCVSSLGVTGMRSEFKTDFSEFISEINKYSKIPKMVGFGISTPEQVFALKGYFDGVIVGSAIVDIIASSDDKVKKVGEFVRVLREAL